MADARPHLIQVSNGLLDPEHVSRIGPAIWVFLALIDMQTKPDGTVLDLKKEIRIQDIAERLGLPERTIRRHLLRLRPYLDTRRTRGGFRIRIRNPKKRFKEQSRPAKNGQPRTANSGHSQYPDRPKIADETGQKCLQDRPKMADPYIEEGLVSDYSSDKQGHAGQAEVLSKYPGWVNKLRDLGTTEPLLSELVAAPWVNGNTDAELAADA